MRRTLLLVLLVLAPAARAATLDIPSAGPVILHSGKWTPSQADADAAFRCAQHFLAMPTLKEKYELAQVSLIREHARQYRVQVVGQYRKGKRIILCNFFPIQFPEEKQDGFYYWKKQLVEVMDGGFWFWRIEYDPQSDSCGNFSSNGYA